MKIRVVRNDVASIKTPALVVNLFDGVKKPGGATGAIDKALDGAISQLIKDGEIKGKKGETTLIHTFGKIPAARVVVLGLGKRESFTTNTVREVTAASSRYLRKLGVTKAATIAHGGRNRRTGPGRMRPGHRRRGDPWPVQIQDLPH